METSKRELAALAAPARIAHSNAAYLTHSTYHAPHPYNRLVNLFSPLHLGDYELPNRIVMAPMTRSRADVQGTPSPLAVEYYASRANAGLLITEGTGPSPAGMGYARTPGIYTGEQIAAWRSITDAVHSRGGRIFLQIMHVGRIAHSLNRTSTDVCVAPSAIRAEGQMWTDSQGMQPLDMPRALETAEIPFVIAEFVRATNNAIAAGFDGVELHAASGYLPNQFLSATANQRDDDYGGSIENRIRFVVETLSAMIVAAGSPGKVGIKVSPGMKFNDIRDDDPIPTYLALAEAIAPLRLAYLHVMRTGIGAEAALRKTWPGTLLVGGGFRKAEANQTIAEGRADAIVFGSSFLANPDLVKRLEIDAPLNQPDPSTFYTPGPKGYTDYPAL
jgi:N-ethylmaleimide reductase